MRQNRRSGDYSAETVKKSTMFEKEPIQIPKEDDVDIKDMDPQKLFRTRMISINKIDSHENNTYQLKAIEPLALSIVRHRMWQLPVIKESYDEENERVTGRYTMIVGHRRKEAYTLNHLIADLLMSEEPLDSVYNNSKPEMHATLDKIVAIIKEDPKKYEDLFSSIPCTVLSWNCSKDEEEAALNDTNLHNRQTEADEALKQIDYIIKDNDIDLSLPVRDVVNLIKNEFELLGYESWGNTKIRSYLLAYKKDNKALNDAIVNNKITSRELEYLVSLPTEEIEYELNHILDDPTYLDAAKAKKKNILAVTKKVNYRKVSINIDMAAKKLAKIEPDLVKFKEANNVSNKYSEDEAKLKIEYLKKMKKDINSSIANLIKLLEG